MAKKDSYPLNETQKAAARHSGGPLLIAAGAGSGKTRTLTGRLIHLLESGVKPEKIVAVTFTNKAAKEMQTRMADSFTLEAHSARPFIGTFHSLGVRILKEEAPVAGRLGSFTIFDEDDSLSLIKNIMKEINLSKERFNPMVIANQISQIKNEVLDFNLSTEEKTEKTFEKIVYKIYENYENKLSASNAFDFDDLIEKTVRLFRSNQKILEKYQNRWQHILVDEYQDVNTSQYLLIKLLAQKHRNLFVIGDDAQSIYAFRGSDFRNFLNFEKDWREATVVKLEENYRSTKNIIQAASELIKNNKMQKPKKLWTNNPEGSLIQLLAFQNSEEEAWGVAKKISELPKNNEQFKDIAIIYRTNAQSRAIEQALIQLQIPYEIFGGLKFYARKEIKDIVAGLRYAFNPQDSVSFERLNKNFSRGKSELLIKELPRLAKELSITELINFFIQNTDYLEYLEKNFKNPLERRENIRELINFATSFSDPQKFLEQISLMGGLDDPSGITRFAKGGLPELRREKNAVKLMTAHLAKGLEFNNVFIIGANDGLLPHERSMFKNEELEEERRLMYVAMTRAKNNLCVSFYDLPSRFLGELPPELIEFKQITGRREESRDWNDETIYII